MAKTAIITGGSRGIGRAICLRLARDGYNITFSYINNKEEAYKTVQMCEQHNVIARTKKVNVSNTEECKLWVEEIKHEFQNIDVLVNNAGITRDGLIMKMKDEDLDLVIDTNLKGTFYMSREVSKIMIKQRFGKIINISSIVGLSGNIGQANYAASKSGVIGLTKSLAKELASRKINVNAVAPGMIITDMTNNISDKARETAILEIPFKEAGKPEDIASIVSFLASPESTYITGQTICVDGGMSI